MEVEYVITTILMVQGTFLITWSNQNKAFSMLDPESSLSLLQRHWSMRSMTKVNSSSESSVESTSMNKAAMASNAASSSLLFHSSLAIVSRIVSTPERRSLG